MQSWTWYFLPSIFKVSFIFWDGLVVTSVLPILRLRFRNRLHRRIDWELRNRNWKELGVYWSLLELYSNQAYRYFFFSGTTGPPKGVMLSNRNLSIMLPNFAYMMKKQVFPYINKKNPITVNDPQQNFLPFYHIFGMGTLLTNLYLGITTIAMPKFDFEVLCKNVQEYKVGNFC